jgi:hypothetical protein
MPIEYDIIADKKLVLAKGSGVITGADVIRHLDVLAADDRYKAPMKKLVDYRNVDSIRISLETAYSIAQKKIKLANIFAGERCAFVSPWSTSYGSSHLHRALVDGSGINTAVFRCMEDALGWLDVELDMSHG